MHDRWRSALLGRLDAPVDIASLVVFRVSFGLIMLWEMIRFFTHGWITYYYLVPVFHFKYYGFGWVHPWPGAGMHLHFAALAVLGLMIACGYAYRLSTVLFFLGFSFVFLIEKARYLNHFYLIVLMSLLMIFVPAHRCCSIDARRWPSKRSTTAPTWSLWLLRAQVGIVYFYAGVAKLNGDWLRGEPLRIWLADRADMPLVGAFFQHEACVYLFSYGGLLFDLLAFPLLLWSRSRPLMLLLAVCFHLTNAVLFGIGVFPWFMIAATALFMRPDWPRRVGMMPRGDQGGEAAASILPHRSGWRNGAVAGLLVAYLLVQIAVPLRHFAYPGSVHWTEEGHNFSWHMKLRTKSAGGYFMATDKATGESWQVPAANYLTRVQLRKMGQRPDMILQFSHWLAEFYRSQGRDVRIHAFVVASLNGRQRQLLIDSAVDLAQTPRRAFAHADWIVPLHTALPGR